MKISFIGQKGIPANGGGVERHVDELAPRLADLGHAITVYCRERYTKSTMPTYKGVTLRYTPAIYTKHLEAITHTFTSILDLRKREVDVVHIQMIGPSLLIPLIRLVKPKAKIITTYHSQDYLHQKWNFFARFMLKLGEWMTCKFSDAVITTSKNLRGYVKEKYNCDATYIPSGVYLPELSSDPKLLAKWGLPSQEYIVAISRLVRHKGLHLLIEAYKQMDTTKKLVIVGGSEYTDAYVQELMELAEGNPNIIFTGKQSGKTLHALFEHAYLFAMPTMYEGLSVALLESLSYGLPVLVSDIAPNLETLDGEGYVFASNDVNDLTNKLREALDHPEKTNAMRMKGRDLVQKKYHWKTVTKTTIDLHEEVVNGNRPGARMKKQATR